MNSTLRAITTLLLLLLLLSPPSSFFFCASQTLTRSQRQQSRTTTITTPISQGDVAPATEEKTRLGSMPPSCHNRCATCHPCMAVQVPTPARPGLARVGVASYLDPPRSKYSNYKPLGWKCRCGNRIFGP